VTLAEREFTRTQAHAPHRGENFTRHWTEALAELQAALSKWRHLIVAHNDKAHPHVHLLINRVSSSGGKIYPRPMTA